MNIKEIFWYLIIVMVVLSLLVRVLPFELIMFCDFILFLGVGYAYWEDAKEKEDRLRYLEAEAARRRAEEVQRRREENNRKRGDKE